MEGTETTATNLKSIVEQLDANAPKIEQIDWTIFDAILHNTDFTKTKNVLDAMKLFYQQLWAHVVFPLQDEDHIKQREIGRLIIEADENRRKAKKLEEEITSLREELQKESSKEA